ncbi:Fic family protein [Micromonospora olivasterospora]|uniref:Fic/DOC family protein n=1 Tax=Micromonospora olivasterospora TaxID=1880 RepID=A0A562IGW6_MICOL|nr:Fic family protein [Micromonospora olivasterospora]TWH69993.1 Fic/DOC family protein [Micromonospora olivasterospora]
MATELPWRSVEPLPELNGDVAELLAAIGSLRRVWEENLSVATPEEVEEARKRSLRRHAIETGVIERLYDVDWDVTEALVAEGLTLEAAAGKGGITEDTLAVIRDQYSALDYLAKAARGDTSLTLQFIRELHVLITRNQPTYDAMDQFGRIVKVPLPHGEWKKQANSVTRDDGTRISFVPPEHVQSEMELLVARYEEAASAHPLVRAAWLHHRFICIHPFADGNGRVARALTLLVLLQARYAPLVVDRRQRADYIAALDRANDGDLRPLVRFFARLERIALTSELTRPVEVAPAGESAVEVARAYAQRLRILVEKRNDKQGQQARALAKDVHGKLVGYLQGVREQFQDAFRAVDGEAKATVIQAIPPEERALWWRAQLVRTANAVDFYSNLREGSWWAQLRLTVLGQTLRYVVAVQKVGRGETGVLAVTTFAESVENHADAEHTRAVPLLNSTPDDSVTLIYSDSADARWSDVCELVDRTLAAAIAGFSNGLG